jgi:hypothetical protein
MNIQLFPGLSIYLTQTVRKVSPLIDAAVLECMQKSSSANAEPKEVSRVVMNQFLDNEEMKEPKTRNILIGKILNRVHNLNKKKSFVGIKSLEMSCDINTFNEKFKLFIPPGYVPSIPKTQSALKVIMENLKSNGMNTLPPQRIIKEGNKKGEWTMPHRRLLIIICSPCHSQMILPLPKCNEYKTCVRKRVRARILF